MTQADREAAFALGRYGIPGMGYGRTDGVNNRRPVVPEYNDLIVQAFARHRISATSEASLSVERMREALEPFAVALNTTAEGG